MVAFRSLVTRRSIATSASSSLTLSSSSSARSIAQHHRLPFFSVRADDVQLLAVPRDFYDHLLQLIRRARRRIFLATLYVGKNEVAFVSSIAQRLRECQDVQVTILVDGLRSTREGTYRGTSCTQSCASLLAALQASFPDRVEVRAFRAFGLPSWLERTVGKRFVEGYGLQHMKLYGNEEEVMVSGANLSHDYFENRRDRYVTIKDSQLSQYAFELLQAVGRFSHSLRAVDKPDNDHAPYMLEWDEGRRLHMNEKPTGPKRWNAAFRRKIDLLTSSWHARNAEKSEGKDAVHIVPLLQMGPIGVRQETDCVPSLLRTAKKVDFTTGYFSINPLYARSILDGAYACRMITAAPEANGFFGSHGISRHLPAAYTWLERRFYQKLVARNRQEDVVMNEWKKLGWTYHAKGIWTAPSLQSPPTVSLLGSTNFGVRSATLDLECTLLIDASRSSSLQARLGREVEEIGRDATDRVGTEMFARPERKVHWGVKVAAWCIQRML